ncbi:E3 SUMO-protein ligase KIAA1586-like [Hydra vulgaris]|uniref:E3 SUMO-protein ligase KIAA1586-like n=1 Tax=Hydra vulgaris TaxID=6087 RepID=A0ABM4B9P3_HYDVU
MGRILHSTNACIIIVNHIGNEMSKKIIAEVIKSKSKISIIINESTTISQKSALIVYIWCCVKGSGMNSPINLFLDLVELESVKATGQLVALLECLHSYGMKDEYLKNYLVSVAFWHCANHRLELSVGDTIREILSINRFKSFLDKLYVMYHATPKNRRELRSCAELLNIQLLKIGRILNARWVSSRFRSVFAVWENYEALVKHFEEAVVGPTWDKNEKSTYAGLMCDALQKLSELSLDLQKRNINLYKANKKIKALVQWARILDQNHWPDNINNQVTFGETEIRNLSLRLPLNEREIIRGFLEYLAEKTYPENLVHLVQALDTIPISSSECERGFSQTNLIITPTRASLMTKTVSTLLFIELVGPPLTSFDPSKYIDSWLLSGRHSAVDTKSKERRREDMSNENLQKLWDLL